jgi:hypothetical protein
MKLKPRREREREGEMKLYDVNFNPNEPKKNRTNVEKKLNST